MPHNIYKTIVFSLLRQMKRGTLHFSAADNENYTFGENDEVIADIKVRNPAFFKQVVLYGDIGFGEAYMDGQLETTNLTGLIAWFIINTNFSAAGTPAEMPPGRIHLFHLAGKISQTLRHNSLRGARKNIAAHYDLSNDFFRLFLDPTMTYSCALFQKPDDNLEQAQRNKYDSLCDSIQLRSSDHVLDIGCGWGGFAIHAAKKYDCRVTGITISQEQFQLASERIKKEKLEHQVDIRLTDYRNMRGKFDKLVSIEMIEAVGHKYFKPYFAKIFELLKPAGALGLQAIIVPDYRYDQHRKSADWIRKHIFPGGLLPSIQIINHTINQTGSLNLYSLKEMGKNYAQTLRNWSSNLHSNLPQVKKLGLDDRFIRKWEFYLCGCEASFFQRNINVVQMVYARPNNAEF